MSAVIDWLIKSQWAMGNGQCSHCHGVHKGWYGHPLHITPDTIGHEPDCHWVKMARENDLPILVKGWWEPTIEEEEKAAPKLEFAKKLNKGLKDRIDYALFKALSKEP